MRTVLTALTFITAAFLSGEVNSNFAEEPAESDVASLKSAVDDALTKQQAVSARLKQTQNELTQLKALLSELKSKVDADQKAVPELEKQIPPQKQAVEKAQTEKQQADAALAEAQKIALEKKSALESAEAKLKKTETEFTAAKNRLAESRRGIEQAEKKLPALVADLSRIQTEHETAGAELIVKQRELERALIAKGELVSFADSIAPIFARRCLACHNARTAKGRFNMETFAAIMKGGESGEAIIPGDGEFSNLYLLVDDGSMPKEADPLSKEELALIKKWIGTGAQLDAGVDPSAPLITIMPKPIQPTPPESYRLPIPVTALAFSPDGSQLASSGYHEVLLWNPADGALLRRVTNVAERIYDIEFSADGQSFAVAAGTPGQMGEVKVFRSTDGELLADLLTTGDSVFAVRFSPDGKRLAAAGADRSIRVFDLDTGEEQLLIEDHADWVTSVAWSPDGKHLASASRDKTAKVFDASNGDSLVTFNGHGEPVFGVAFLPDGKQVVTAGRDKQLRIWNVSDAKQTKTVGGFGGEVLDLVVTSEGKALTGGSDKAVRLHQLPAGNQIRAMSGHSDWVYAVTMQPGSERFASGSYDGQIQIWDSSNGQSVTTFIAAPGFTDASTE